MLLALFRSGRNHEFENFTPAHVFLAVRAQDKAVQQIVNNNVSVTVAELREQLCSFGQFEQLFQAITPFMSRLIPTD